MAGKTPIDSEDTQNGRPRRQFKPSAALLQDPGQVALPSQQQAVVGFLSAQAARRTAETLVVETASATPSSIPASPSRANSAKSPQLAPTPVRPSSPTNSKCSYIQVSDDNEEDNDACEGARTNPKPAGMY
jgi:hypothetical protein